MKGAWTQITIAMCMLGIGIVLIFIGCLDSSNSQNTQHTQRNSLSHEAYVWQRSWTGPVRDAVLQAPGELTGLRVLALEIEDGHVEVWPKVHLESLVASHRPITVVVRVNGSRPIKALSLAPLLERVAAWQHAGANVVGIEVDHDCATNALADYVSWLENVRPPTPLRFSITALPTWMDSEEIESLSQTVDEMVLQVHAIRVPRIFDVEQARSWIYEFSQRVGGLTFRVALPTYRVEIAGQVRTAKPMDVRSLLNLLEDDRPKGLEGFVWFRLPVLGDDAAWSAATLSAVISGDALAADVRVHLVSDGVGLFSVVLENHGNLDGRWPELALGGAVEAADFIAGYRQRETYWVPPEQVVVAGEVRTIGWIRGKDVVVDVVAN